MRGASMDRQILIPHAVHWGLLGGAYREGKEIVLPEVGSRAEMWVLLRGVVGSINLRTPVLVPPGGSDNIYHWVGVYGADRTTLVDLGWGAAPQMTTGRWTHATRTISADTDSIWLRYYFQITPSYGVPGTRIRPSQDSVITYL